MHEVFPEAKILAVIREQRGMIVPPPAAPAMGADDSIDAFPQPPLSQNMRLPRFDSRHFEHEHRPPPLPLAVPPDSMLGSLAFEEFVREPRVFVAAIGRFAGRPIDDALIAAMPFADVRRPSLSALELEVRRRRNRLVRSELNPAPSVESRLLKRLTKLAEEAAAKPLVRNRLGARADRALHESVAETVGDRYRESNRATAELTGLDLARYGWML